MKYLLFALVAPLIISCDKETATEPTQADVLVQQTWKYDNAGIDPDRNGTIDITLPAGTIPSCQTDNTLTFKSNGTGVIDEGATKCDASLPQTLDITWHLLNNGGTLHLAGGGFAGFGGEFKVITLNDKELSLLKDTTINLVSTSLLLKLKH